MLQSVFDLNLALNIITTVSVVLGIAFGLLQLRHSTQKRRDYAAVDIVRTVQTQSVRRAVSLILKLPKDTDPDLIRNDPKLLKAALAVDSACEMWGCMVFEQIVDHHLLDRMVGGWVRGTWSRLHKWVESERIINQNPNVGEWWQWLFELIEKDPDPGKNKGAYDSYRGRKKRKSSI